MLRKYLIHYVTFPQSFKDQTVLHLSQKHIISFINKISQCSTFYQFSKKAPKKSKQNFCAKLFYFLPEFFATLSTVFPIFSTFVGLLFSIEKNRRKKLKRAFFHSNNFYLLLFTVCCVVCSTLGIKDTFENPFGGWYLLCHSFK